MTEQGRSVTPDAERISAALPPTEVDVVARYRQRREERLQRMELRLRAARLRLTEPSA